MGKTDAPRKGDKRLSPPSSSSAGDLPAAIAVTRFGLGARPGEIAAARSDPRGWLKAQIARQGADQPAGDGAPMPDMQSRFAEFRQYRTAAQAAKGDMEARRMAL